jgi:hypothetical protein
MEVVEMFEYIFLENGKYRIGEFTETVNILNEKRYKDFKFKYLSGLHSCLKRHKLIGYPSNCGVNGWARQSINIHCLKIYWVSNFSYEKTSGRFEPKVEIKYQDKLLKVIHNIDTTKKFVNILNTFYKTHNVINLIEEVYGIEKCYLIIKKALPDDDLLAIFNSQK